MANFDSSNTKKSFNELSEEFVEFWKVYFEHHGITPNFKTKLCYNSKELPLKDGEKQQAVRFFKSELDDTRDTYIELCDWDHNFYDPMYRKLYKLTPDPDWMSKPEKYIVSGNAKYPTYAVNVKDLELINETSITSSIPVLSKVETEEEPEPEFPTEEEMFGDFNDDDHYSKMTIRDIYCIFHKKPHSNKEWLNELIKKG